MKKILLGAVLSVLLVAPAFAVNSNTGCGLGSILWSELGKEGNNQPLVFQILEATTNGTFGSQTFGITTGTSNCKKPSAFVQSEKLNEFVLQNMDNLMKDIAAGKGEYLATYAELMGVPSAERPAFYSAMQKNFGAIFTSEKVEMAQVVDNISAIR